MKIKWKEVFIVAGVFTAYKLYELYRTGQELLVNFKSGKFTTLNLDGNGRITGASMNLRFSLFNQTKSTMKLRGVVGKVSVDGQSVAFIKRGPFIIGQGENSVTFPVDFQGEAVMATLANALKKETPTFDVELTYKLPFFSYTDKFKMPPNEYLTKEVQNLLSFIR
jgi:hypothetical protein